MATPDPAALAPNAEAARRVDAGRTCSCAVEGPFGAGYDDDLAGLPEAAVQVSPA